jgi:hypothetical protein
MSVAVTGGQLHDTQGVPAEAQSQRLGINSDLRAQIQAIGQVALVKVNGHAAS